MIVLPEDLVEICVVVEGNLDEMVTICLQSLCELILFDIIL